MLSNFLPFLLLPILCIEIKRASGIGKANDAEAAQRFDGSATLGSKVEGTFEKKQEERHASTLYIDSTACVVCNQAYYRSRSCSQIRRLRSTGPR